MTDIGTVPAYPLRTPAFVYEDTQLSRAARRARTIADASNCRLLYSPKACSVVGVLRALGPQIDGFACSSLYEGRLAKEISADRKKLHLTTPGLRHDDLDAVAALFDVVVLNSLSQMRGIGKRLRGRVRLGLRVNPQISFAEDVRYDPCRRNSKLGVPIDRLVRSVTEDSVAFDGLDGLHLHNNCDSREAEHLVETVNKVAGRLEPLLHRVRWINLGGGYLFDELDRPDLFVESVQGLRERFNLEIFLEPGAALVRSAGSLVSRVLDLFEGDDVPIAVLDTSVNHMPEVLEYDYVPDVLGHVEGAAYRYLLAGATCLAGDQFGVSHFERPLEIGSLVTFPNTGAYAFSRANMFNGLPLPHIYRRTAAGELILEREATFDDFAERMGVNRHVRA